MIRCISFNFEITSYKNIFDLLCLFAWLCRDIASPNLHLYEMKKVTRVSKRIFFYPISKVHGFIQLFSNP